MTKVQTDFDDKVLSVSLDLDEDGKKSFSLKMFNSEAIEELFKRSEPKEGVKIAKFEFRNGGLYIEIDTDRDGEPLLILEANPFEAWDELA
jgi:hypothetical protein